MEITSITLSLARPPVAPSHPFSSSQSNFFSTGSTISLLNKAKSQTKSVSFVVGRPRRGTTAEPGKKGLTCNALFGLGVPELVVIAGVAALLFGPKKLPEVGKSIGKTVKSFQQAAKEFETELKKEPESITEQPKENTTAVSEEKKPDLEVSSSKESSPRARTSSRPFVHASISFYQLGGVQPNEAKINNPENERSITDGSENKLGQLRADVIKPINTQHYNIEQA